MRFHRFYLQEKIGQQKSITVKSAELSNQIGHVFRLKSGDNVIVFDGCGNDFICRIATLNKDSVLLEIVSQQKSQYLPEKRVNLYASIIKKDKFEWIIEKATELGVSRIIPVIAERSEKKNLNLERLKKIAIEASEQSGRGDLPNIGNVFDLNQALSEISRFSPNNELRNIVFHTQSDQKLKDGSNFEKVVALTKKAKEINIFIGPEGGWSPKEIETFKKNGLEIMCLGKQILKSETAMIAAVSMFVFS